MLVLKLKASHKDMEHRLHPWMNSDIRESIIELESEEIKGRRRTFRGDANLSGHRAGKEEKPSFRQPRDPIDEAELNEFKESHKTKNNIKSGGGKPTEGACVPGQCNIF